MKHSGKLTKTVVQAWEFNEKDRVLWDGNLPGFGVRANRDGSKSFIIDYRNRYNTKRRYTIGKMTEMLTADKARKKADALLSSIRVDGFDPLGAERATRNAAKVNEMIDAYLASAKFASKADSTKYMDRSRAKRHLRPTLGKFRVEEVTPDRVRRAFADIRDGKTAVVEKTGKRGKARVRGGETAARGAIKLLRSMFTWAIQEGIANTNPVVGVEIGQNRTRETILETPQQYADLFAALDRLQTHRQIQDAAADAIRVLAFTGARRNEIVTARWSWVDLEAGTVTVPAAHHKGGHSSGKAKVVALNSAARTIIGNRPRGKPADFVFPSRRGDSHITLPSKLWKLIRAEAGLPEGITNHALRHSLGTLMAAQGAEAAQIMAALGHSQLSTTQRYIHLARDTRAELAERFTAGIVAAVDNPKADVVDLKDKRRNK